MRISLLNSKTILLALCAALLLTAGIPAAGAATKKTNPGPRHGGKVRHAWPDKGTKVKPRRHLARFLAKQVGPGTPRRVKRRVVRSAAVIPAVMARSAGDLTATKASFVNPSIGAGKPLDLVRSFDIPENDPAYDRLLNLSFTYDSAIATIAFVHDGDQAQAERLLDQLAALQHKDGSLATAYDTGTGAEVPSYRSGTVAWVGMAAVAYERRYGTGRYEAMAQAAADWLMARTDPKTGLVRGGPDVSWISTQHNIVAYFFLRDLSNLKAQTDEVDEAQGDDGQAADEIGDGIEANLINRRYTSLESLNEGVGDRVQALDVQALGAAFFSACGCSGDAGSILAHAIKRYAVGDRSIELSPNLDTFNMTYEAKGPFQGFRPYLTRGAPNVLWMEGTNEMIFVMNRFGLDTDALQNSAKRWAEETGGGTGGLLGADRTVTKNDFNEYHVWPTSAATSWGLIAQLGNREFLDADAR